MSHRETEHFSANFLKKVDKAAKQRGIGGLSFSESCNPPNLLLTLHFEKTHYLVLSLDYRLQSPAALECQGRLQGEAKTNF